MVVEFVGAFGVAGEGNVVVVVSVTVDVETAVVRAVVAGAGVVGRRAGFVGRRPPVVVVELLAVFVCVKVVLLLLLLDAGVADTVVAGEVDAFVVDVAGTWPCTAWIAAGLQQLCIAPCLSGQQLPNLPLQPGEAPQDRSR